MADVEKMKEGCEKAIYKCGCRVLTDIRLRRGPDGCGVSAAEEGKKGLLYNFLGQLSLPTALKNIHVYKPYTKFMKLRRCPVGQKSNWFFFLFPGFVSGFKYIQIGHCSVGYRGLSIYQVPRGVI